MNRRREEDAARLASEAGINAELVFCLQPEGHSVVRYVDGSRPLEQAKVGSKLMIPRLAELLRAVHGLGPIGDRHDPYADIARFLGAVVELGTPQPPRLWALLERVAATEQRRRGKYKPVLCHNDPYHRNVLTDGDRLWMIDWEFAGINDPLYDLAGMGYLLDDEGKKLLLTSYFGDSTEESRNELEEMIAVFLCWNVAWSLVHVESNQLDFDYRGFAEELLDLVP